MTISSCRYVSSIAGFALILFLGISAEAGTLTVKSNADSGGTCPGATCTLRQAIVTATDGDTIDFNLSGSITLTSASLLVNKSLVISGPGANQLNVTGNGFPIFDITGGNVTIAGLTVGPGTSGVFLQNGTLTMNDCAISGNTGTGGGLALAGTTLNMNRCTISGNQDDIILPGQNVADGGGLQNLGTATLTNCTISGNTTKDGGAGTQSGNGGGINNNGGSVTLISCTVTGNTAEVAGGGIQSSNGGTFQLTNTVVANNTSPNGPDCSGTFSSSGYNLIRINGGTGFTNNVNHDQVGTVGTPREPLLGPLQNNGGLTNTHALLSGSPAIEAGNTAVSNLTDQRGLARVVDSPSIANIGNGSDIGAYEVQADVLPGCSNINKVVMNANDSGANSLRGVIASVCAGSTITFDPSITGVIQLTSAELSLNKSLSIIGPGANVLGIGRSSAAGTPDFRIFNVASNVNVAISELAIADGNATSGAGGGISNSGTLTLTSDFITLNSAAIGGGGIHNNGGVLTIIRTNIEGNSVNTGGGGILNSGGTLTLTNSTITGNQAKSGNGGGLTNAGTTTITSSTISENFTISGAGGGVNNFSGTVTVRNSIIALNTSATAPDCTGALISDGFNLIGNSSGTTIAPVQFTDQIGTAGSPIDPLLGLSTYYGGKTGTRSLLPGSPAIDKGDSGGLTTDQRGFPRPIDLGSVTNVNGGDGSDIGAFEVQATPILTPGNSSLITLGDPVADSAALSGGSSPTGTMTFRLFGPSDPGCSGATTKTFTLNVNGNGTYITAPFTPTLPGLYQWVVTYSGDASNIGLSSTCGAANQTFFVIQPVLGNISTRLQVGTGNNVLFAGFIIQGSASKKVLIRSAGPSLSSFGVPGALGNPQLELHDANTTIGTNDNWQTTQLGGVIASDQVAAIQASGAAPADPMEPAIIATLPAGSYTAIVRGAGDSQGVATVEVYDLGPNNGATLANISTRGFIQTGDNVMIGGFIVVGRPLRALIRATGPSLIPFGISNALTNPRIELHDANGTLGGNDDWQNTQLGGIITSDLFPAIQSSGLAPSNTAESAIIATLAPGNYTAIAQGVNGETGVGVVEVFALP